MNPMLELARSEGHKPTVWHKPRPQRYSLYGGSVTPKRRRAMEIIGNGITHSNFVTAHGGSEVACKSMMQSLRLAGLVALNDGVWQLTDMGRSKLGVAEIARFREQEDAR